MKSLYWENIVFYVLVGIIFITAACAYVSEEKAKHQPNFNICPLCGK